MVIFILVNMKPSRYGLAAYSSHNERIQVMVTESRIISTATITLVI